MVKDYYKLLQVRRDASSEVIAAAYKRLMRDAHPDHGGDAERAKRLNVAYETLSDPNRRKAYNLQLNPEQSSRERSLMEELSYRLGVAIAPRVRRMRRQMRDL